MTFFEKPKCRRGESPPEYYKRTRCCPDDFTRIHKRRFYCNPAHCSRTWKTEAERDEHLDMAYSLLG